MCVLFHILLSVCIKYFRKSFKSELVKLNAKQQCVEVRHKYSGEATRLTKVRASRPQYVGQYSQQGQWFARSEIRGSELTVDSVFISNCLMYNF